MRREIFKFKKKKKSDPVYSGLTSFKISKADFSRPFSVCLKPASSYCLK